jgi:hypothetical protein
MFNLKSIVLSAATLATFAITPLQAAGDWFEQQRSISDGGAYSALDAGAQGKRGVIVATSDSQWLEQQLAMSDGYSPLNEAAGTVYVGAALEFDANDSFIERQRRISDGTPE